ncbi:MAG: TIM barrel protein [Candidatus Sulfopaludibacter sp.]|nr:TIM barrel protein [Candidatus Sulfopaludibacter sp.]
MPAFPLGLNTYCLRAMRWPDRKLLEYTAGLKLDGVFLQDSVDPGTNDPAHWKEVKEQAATLGLHLETGNGASLPRTPDRFDASVKILTDAIRRSAAMGSKLVRTLIASDRAALPPGPVEQHIETMIKLFRAVRSQAMDAGVSFALENHKDLLCWQTRQVIEGAGTEFVGSYLDTGNPVFVMEDPMETVETLGPVAVTFHLRDSVVYETRNGIAVQWVPLGDGVVDFKRIVARAKEILPPVYVYIKPITGRPPEILPTLEADFWKKWPDKRAESFARFLALAKSGHPYEREMVIEDVPGRSNLPEFAQALQFQQRDHMERSVEYGKKTLDLGVKWRS